MKARVKATGEIVKVKEEYDLRGAMLQVFYSNEEDPYEVYEKEELDFNVNDNISPTIDYWTRLEHQYAGMAMQGMLASSPGSNMSDDDIAYFAVKFAAALIEKLKNE